MPYSKELNILNHANLLRKKIIHPSYLLDYASNDYLGLASISSLLEKAFLRLKNFSTHSPTSSMAVNGYHQIHRDLEEFLASYFGFPSCTLFGSGFLANLALFDTLVRKNDVIFIDELYHASGKYATKNLGTRAICFAHNDPQDLVEKIKNNPSKGRILIAIEGVYSMDGDIASVEFAKIAQDYNALLIVDEAHSSGVIGENLKGYFDYHDLPILSNYIKMGTLSKAYGSYGAFVLAQKSVIDFLFSKAKSSIYTTAPSLFDIALAHENLLYIQNQTQIIRTHLIKQKEALSSLYTPQAQLAIFVFTEQNKMLEIAQILKNQNFLVGSIRKPTSNTPRLRISLNLKNKISQTKKLSKILQKALNS